MPQKVTQQKNRSHQVRPSNSLVINNSLVIKSQQRQILTMMGVDVWVQRSSPTVTVDLEAISSTVSNTDAGALNAVDAINMNDSNNSLPNASAPTNESSSSNNNINAPNVSQNLSQTQPSFDETGVLNTEQMAVQKEAIQKEDIQQKPLQENAVQKQPFKEVNQSQQVAPFDLLGARYHDWVFLVDGKYLADQNMAKLWQNMSHALSLEAEHLEFPICEGINDKEAADASLAGFVFRLANSHQAVGRKKESIQIKVASLTPLPDGLDDDNLIRVPYLTEMLEDGRQKRQLWQLISEKVSTEKN